MGKKDLERKEDLPWLWRRAGGPGKREDLRSQVDRRGEGTISVRICMLHCCSSATTCSPAALRGPMYLKHFSGSKK